MPDDAFSKSRTIGWVAAESSGTLRRALAERAYHPLTLDGTGVTDRTTLARAITHGLPLDPPIGERLNWDALNDSLFNGLSDLERPRVAILRERADHLLAGDAELLFIACEVFQQIAGDLRTADDGATVRLSVFLLGDGPSFKPFGDRPPPRARWR